MASRKSVKIGFFAQGRPGDFPGHAVVAVDVIRATTTAVTAASQGRRCFPTPSIEAAVPLAASLHDPLLVGELGGNKPYGFHLNNSPHDIALRTDTYRPMILLSTSGTRLICDGIDGQAMYVASLRNWRAQVEHLAENHHKVAVIGAGSRGEFREEDQLCCAWITEGLMKAGFEADDKETGRLVETWHAASVDSITSGKSTKYLVDSGQERDLEFVLEHVDDLREAYLYDGLELIRADSYSSDVRTGKVPI